MSELTSLLSDVTKDDDLDQIVEKACAMSRKQQEKLIEWIVENTDACRLDLYGGYPAQWKILDKVDEPLFVLSTVDHDGAPSLEISTFEELFRENIDLIGDTLTDEWDEDNDGIWT